MKNIWKLAVATVFLHAYAATSVIDTKESKQLLFDILYSDDKRQPRGSEYHGPNYAEKTKHSTKSVPHRKTKRRQNNAYTGINFIRTRRDLGSTNILITQHFNDKTVSPSEDVSLQCTATADRPPRFIWERDGVVISSNTDPRYTLGQMMASSGLGVVTQLNISRSRVEDGGFYSCIAFEGDSNVGHMARVDVYGPPYIRTLPPIKVQSGEPLKLRCPYYGYPISKIEWEHKGKKIVSTSLPQHIRYKRHNRRPKRQMFEPGGDGVLNIARVDKDSGDTYTCVVYSTNGEMARRSFEIQVVEAPELDELRVGTGLKEGQIVQITCNIISGDPPIYFSWLKDGKKISASLKITERSSELFSVLIIKRVSLEHCGKYTCIATNHVGKVNQTADLYINVAPKWIDEQQNTSLLLGQRGVVYCNANGYPTPQIHWMKRDAGLGIWRPVLDLAGGGVMSLPNGTLIIEVVSLSDEGMYACNVENGVGDALNRNIWISVNKPVHFEAVSSNLTTKVGLPVSLPCLPLGDSPIRVKWTHGGKLIDFTSARVTISETVTHNGVSSVININYVETRDGGVYECRASNPYGMAVFNVFLNILEPPTPPHDLQLDSVSSTSARLSWRDGGAHAHYYTLQYTDNEYQMWDTAKTINVTRRVNEIRQTAEIRELQSATEYRVRVSAGNQVALSAHTQPVHFTTSEEAPSSPPLGVQVQQAAEAGSLAVSWVPPHGARPGLQGYRVRATPALDTLPGPNDTQTKTVKVSSRQAKQETLLTGLLKNTRYAVSVVAFNSAGDGPYSLPVYQTTREGAPEHPPSAVECRGVSSTSLRVSWQPINTQGTSLLGYSIYYGTEDGPFLNITSPHTEIYLQALLKYTNYTVKVAGFSNYGVGPFSYPIVCPTLQDVPGQPAAIKVVVSSATSLLVSWKKPEQPNGQITHYTVYVKPVSGLNSPQSYRVEATANRQLTFPLTGLAGRQYEVSVTAHTTAGEGAASSVAAATLTDRVVAGVASLGGTVSVGVGSSLLLVCQCVGVPPPRTVWYHKHNIITHHPRFTRNHDDSLLINNIDQSLSGNYTCLAKNLYGSDSVEYTVSVLATPAPPALTAAPHKHSIHLQWDAPVGRHGNKITYNLTWKETTGSWQDTWSNKETTLQGVQEYTLQGLKCGTKYSVRITAVNAVGSSPPAYIDVATLGGVPIAPTTTEWLWSNATHIYIQLSGWDDNGCEVTSVEVDYREYGSKTWRKGDNKLPQIEHPWPPYTAGPPTSFAVGPLLPAQWYQLRVAVTNSAGRDTHTYNYATTTLQGETIGPPTEFFDINMVVIICSSILLMLCSLTCVYILVKRHNHQHLTEYRNSLTTECKSERSNVTINTPQGVPSDINRVYSTPVHLTADAKHELYEISPYAQFALGFRTFGHQDNQEAPTRLHLPGNSKPRYDSETSFQLRSESEESDCVSRTTTLKSAPRKACRIPHHR